MQFNSALLIDIKPNTKRQLNAIIQVQLFYEEKSMSEMSSEKEAVQKYQDVKV